MKVTLKLTITLLALGLFACNSDDALELTINELSGEWAYSADEQYILDFYAPGQLSIGPQFYTYEISGSTLTLEYSGPYFILLPPSEHRILQYGNTIRIDQLEDLWYFEPDDKNGVFRR